MIKFLWWELNIEEFFIGSCIQFPFIFVIGWWVLLLMPLSGLLWAIGGSKEGEKIVRRLGVPIATLTFLVAYNTKYWPCAFSSLAAFGVVSMGYGESSWLSKMYSRIFFNDKGCAFATRATTYILYWVCFAVGFAFVR